MATTTASTLAVRATAFGLVAVLAAALAIVATTPQPSVAAGHEHCITDPDGDVHDLTGQPVDDPRADILEVCASYEPGTLTFSLRVDEPTDPQTDDGWQEGDAEIIWTFDTLAEAYGFPTGQLFMNVDDGLLRARATLFDDATPICEGTADFDGTWYEASFDPGCLDLPATISYAGAMVYDREPASDDLATLVGDRAPLGFDGREASGRFAGPLTRSDETPPFDRLTGRFAGPTRIDTAVVISQAEFPQGAEEVYLARQDTFPDALAAGSTTRGPILLVRHCVLPQSVAAEISRLAPKRVIALGGEAAICDDVLDEARELEVLHP